MKVSFVIPSYNCAAFLPHAVESVKEQTYKDWEIVIVDDCSTDSTKDLTDHYQKTEKNIIVHRNEKNLGRSESRNIGNKLATGDIICVLDADDLADPKRAALTVGKFKHGAKVVYGSAVIIDAIGYQYQRLQADFIGKPKIKRIADKMSSPDASPADFHLGIVHSSMAYSKEIAEKYPYQGGKIAELGIDDWDMQVRMILDGVSMDVIPAIITHYRMTPSNITSTRDPKAVMAQKVEILKSLVVTQCA